MLALSLLAGLAGGRDPRSVPLGREAAHLAQGASLWQERDLALTEAEREPWSGSAREAGEAVHLPYAFLLAPAQALAPAKGPLLLNTLLLALTGVAAASELRRRTGGGGWGLVVLGAFCTAVFAYAHLAQPHVLLAAAVVAGVTLSRRAAGAEEGEVPEVYDDRRERRIGGGLWFAAGALLALPVLEHPAYLALFLPPVALAQGPYRWPARLSLLAGGAVSLVGFTLLQGALGGGSPAAVRILVSASDGAGILAGGDPGLLARNVLYLVGGRHGGLVLYFLPAVLLSVSAGPRGRQSLVAVAIALLAILVLTPFEVLDGSVANAAFVPLFAALWMLPTRPPSRAAMAATWLFSAVFLWPLWLSAWRAPLDEQGALAQAAATPHRWLPFELTQRWVPPAGVRDGELWYRALGGGLAAGDSGGLDLGGSGAGNLLVVLPTGLESVYAQFGPESKSELEVAGGTIGETAFLPDGGVVFEIVVDQPRATLPVWWAAGSHNYHVLRLSMPGTDPSKSYPFHVHGGRR